MLRCLRRIGEEIPILFLIEMFTLVRVASILLLVTISVLYNLF
jgi:hypothetical protein